MTEQRGEFNVTQSTVIHDAFGMQLIRHDVERPDRSTGVFFWVNFDKRAVLVFILDDEGMLWMTNEFCYGENTRLQEVPGGTLLEGETIEAAAERRARKEVGAVLDIDSLVHFGTHGEITSRAHNPSELVVARVNGAASSSNPSGEEIRLTKVPFAEAVDKAVHGEIYTAVVALGILRINALLLEAQGTPMPIANVVGTTFPRQ